MKRLSYFLAAIFVLMGAAMYWPVAAARMAPLAGDEEAVDRGQIVFQNNCLMCHTGELVQGQRLTRAQWEAEVTKMMGWGAPVGPEESPDLLAYLMENFGDSKPSPRPLMISSSDIAERTAFLAQPAPLTTDNSVAESLGKGSMLYKTHCESCHGPDARGGNVGTNLIEQPSLLNETDFRNLLRAGRNKMPGFISVLKPEDETDMLRWLLTLPETPR